MARDRDTGSPGAAVQADEGLASAVCSRVLALEPTLEEAFWSSSDVKQAYVRWDTFALCHALFNNTAVSGVLAAAAGGG
ncbi:hypothetical protein OEZ85_002581 [Tetradesmus obliquus]|uniref:Uncharacterized protein n=1 Tax=Tetradesmus obliquus TaxID=3088 RepID=A0ABY8TY00_TETOB|nr:hypothetical protein OEZ85_002581 [Tetradesmus obliquus]